MKTFFLFFLFICAKYSFAQQLHIIPEPVKSDIQTGFFNISNSTVLLIGDKAEKASADFFNEYLKQFYGFSLKVTKEANTNYIRLSTKALNDISKEGLYSIAVTPNSVSISGDTYTGTFYGIQTLIQLLPVQPYTTLKIPCVVIEDYPRFQYRGLLLDVGRHFFPVDFIKKFIDYMVLHKMNYFGWHLTEDQGWRIEIKKYPKLTEIGSCRNGTLIGKFPGTGNDSIKYCGYYYTGPNQGSGAICRKSLYNHYSYH
ncbi:MAG: family 20 glycosylhydrolase [Chitinophagaceae bacterium]